MSKTFLQKDWGQIGKVSMANAGCGPTAIADIVYNVNENITPAKVANWMANKGYFSSNGSTRIGVGKALENYGFQFLYFTPEHTGNKEWSAAYDLTKNTRYHDCWAIALAVGQKNGGKDDFWTYGGHFIAITDYDPETHRIYVRDPAGRRTGYYDADKLKMDCNAFWFIMRKY